MALKYIMCNYEQTLIKEEKNTKVVVVLGNE
jgi:hypothetical protein